MKNETDIIANARNARRLAAIPDLLAALHLANDIIDPTENGSALQFRRIYNAAIAKVEGKSV